MNRRYMNTKLQLLVTKTKTAESCAYGKHADNDNYIEESDKTQKYLKELVDEFSYNNTCYEQDIEVLQTHIMKQAQHVVCQSRTIEGLFRLVKELQIEVEQSKPLYSAEGSFFYE